MFTRNVMILPKMAHSMCQRFVSSNSSILAREIGHFDDLAKTWWDWDGSSRLLHLMNPPRIDFIRSIVKQKNWFPGKRILDVGCGAGILSESLARLGAHVVGLDASPGTIEAAQQHMKQDPSLQNKLRYKLGSIENTNFNGKQFDAVTVMEVVEHVAEPANFLNELMRHVKPLGYVFLSTISRTMVSRLLTLTLAENVLHIVPPGTHTYEKYIRPEEMREFFLEKGWAVNGERSVAFNPFLGKWVLGAPGTKVWCNYFFSAQKPAMRGK
ncbi:hexaprenyldihydroxybenzoate methyltransferase Coq3 [Schizosaccharomyces japonicus yFS275]|uniref:Ubiquinone biosynthesis O-methyltransferase, mitochondrial n=1 Tax=Schizosaccharomyces japonicus (strain yFS275 / FY16936) TaxID=402676 RepID=B6K7D4_SCHJY|nr:hexaprenyldihydroxybenzoate methyltransferase Coq3 [Schizosaccharomyces japonicus yFS275]EEB09438.1 hexaprenyldihydroxybenzoate methyltransferase Coq3 [Schizosaccharomyces japonicus yFS275]